MPIYFYDIHEKPFGCFSNFSPHGFELDGEWWKTSEHYFQAHKFVDTPYLEQIRKLPTPKAAFDFARSHQSEVRSDWKIVRVDIMRKAVERKFQFNLEIREILLATGDVLLVEDSPVDFYWGCGSDRQGKNMLGKILMEVREKLRDL